MTKGSRDRRRLIGSVPSTIVARALELGPTTAPPDALVAVARREGWIHRPRPEVTLEEILAAGRVD